jgi:hypothetical protein
MGLAAGLLLAGAAVNAIGIRDPERGHAATAVNPEAAPSGTAEASRS